MPESDALTKAVDLLFRSTQVIIPVLTGYIVLLSAIVGRLRKDGDGAHEQGLLAFVFLLAGVALFSWLGVMPFCYKAALGFPQDVWGGVLCRDCTPAEIFAYGRVFARIGQLSFAASVILTAIFCWRSGRRLS